MDSAVVDKSKLEAAELVQQVLNRGTLQDVEFRTSKHMILKIKAGDHTWQVDVRQI